MEVTIIDQTGDMQYKIETSLTPRDCGGCAFLEYDEPTIEALPVEKQPQEVVSGIYEIIEQLKTKIQDGEIEFTDQATIVFDHGFEVVTSVNKSNISSIYAGSDHKKIAEQYFMENPGELDRLIADQAMGRAI